MATQYTVETLTDPRFNDVVIWEEYVAAGQPHSRDVIAVQLGSTTTLQQGSVLFRAKGKSATATWDVVNGDADVADTNEYAILIGTDLKTADTTAFTSGVTKNVIAITRRAHIKDSKVRSIVTGLGVAAGEYANLKRLLATQEIIVKDTLTEILA